MARIKLLTMVLSLLLITPSLAQDIRIPGDNVLTYELPSNRWQVSIEAPEVAIEAMVVDMVYYNQKQGKEVPREQVRKQAEKFIRVNNYYIYNSDTEAYMMISFSPRSREEGKLNESAVNFSVNWTIEALNDHAYVEDISGYSTAVEKIEIPGIEYLQMVSSNVPLFGDPHNFIGLIGYNYPYWIFMFYNDKAKDPQDLAEMQQIIKSFKLGKP